MREPVLRQGAIVERRSNLCPPVLGLNRSSPSCSCKRQRSSRTRRRHRTSARKARNCRAPATQVRCARGARIECPPRTTLGNKIRHASARPAPTCACTTTCSGRGESRWSHRRSKHETGCMPRHPCGCMGKRGRRQICVNGLRVMGLHTQARTQWARTAPRPGASWMCGSARLRLRRLPGTLMHCMIELWGAAWAAWRSTSAASRHNGRLKARFLWCNCQTTANNGNLGDACAPSHERPGNEAVVITSSRRHVGRRR